MCSTASYPSESNFLFFWQLKTKKNAWPKSWELRFVWGPYWGLKPRKAASEIALRDLFQRGLREESGSIGVFAEIKKVVEHQKITANHTHTHTHTHNRLLKLISMLFCVWKEARVWATEIIPLISILTIRASILFFSILNPPPSWIPCTFRAAVVADGFLAAASFVYWHGRWPSLSTLPRRVLIFIKPWTRGEHCWPPLLARISAYHRELSWPFPHRVKVTSQAYFRFPGEESWSFMGFHWTEAWSIFGLSSFHPGGAGGGYRSLSHHVIGSSQTTRRVEYQTPKLIPVWLSCSAELRRSCHWNFTRKGTTDQIECIILGTFISNWTQTQYLSQVFLCNHDVSQEEKNKNTFCEWGKGLIVWFLIKVQGLGDILVKSAEVLSLKPDLAEVSDFTKKLSLQAVQKLVFIARGHLSRAVSWKCSKTTGNIFHMNHHLSGK